MFIGFYQNKHSEVSYFDNAFAYYTLKQNLSISIDSPSDFNHMLSINSNINAIGISLDWPFPFQSSHQTQYSPWTSEKVVATALLSSLAPKIWFLFCCFPESSFFLA